MRLTVQTRRRVAGPLIASLVLWATWLGAQAADTPGFAGHWEDCENFADACYGYRLDQNDTQVCGSLTHAPKGDARRTHGHIRGVSAGDLLAKVAVCGVESRSTCPQIVPANRRGLLLCGDTLYETGGRRYTCAEIAEQAFSKPYRRVSATAFAQRFGPQPPSLCAVPISTQLEATPPPR